MKHRSVLAIATSLFLLASVGTVSAQPKEQFVPMNGIWVGPYAAGGAPWFSGYIDYLQLVNERDGGVNGVKFTWEKCETEYNTTRGVECYERTKKNGPTGATVLQPFSTGTAYALIDRVAADGIPMVTTGFGRSDTADGRVFKWIFPVITSYWSQNTAKIRFMGARAGGMEKLKGMKVAHLYHDSAYGKENLELLDTQAKMYGFQVTHIPVPPPGSEQQAQWLQIRQAKPDWVILRGWGVMTPVAIKQAAKVGFPVDKIIGSWWAGTEEDVIGAGAAAKGYIAAAFNMPGADFPVMKAISTHVYDKNKGELSDRSRIGTVMHGRGVLAGLITAEAVRIAQEKFGKGQPINGDQMRWGLEHLKIDENRLKELGVAGIMQPLSLSCMDHEGGGAVKFIQWDGKRWNQVSDWIESDKSIVRPMVERSAANYAKEKGITPRDCAKEN